MLKKLVVSFFVVLFIGFCFVSCDCDKCDKGPLIKPYNARTTPLSLENYETNPLTVTVNITGFSPDDTKLKYSIDGGEKIAMNAGSNTITVEAGGTVSFYGDRKENTSSDTNYITINCNNNCYVYGNVMSLITSTDFATSKSLEAHPYAFFDLFFGNIRVETHPKKKLLLPAITLSKYCYAQMFFNCSALTVAPELPATNLADHCYFSMFSRCVSLSSAPALSATTLADSCYQSMFQDCTTLTETPVLPAKALVNYCYKSMFEGCGSLSSITCLATSNTAIEPTDKWLVGVASSGTFTKSSEAVFTWAINSQSGIPAGWTAVDAE